MERPTGLNPLSNEALLAIHDANSVSRLAAAVFRVIHAAMPCEVVLAALRPLEFELAGISSKTEHNDLFARYIQTDHKLDVWLKRSPIHPRVTVVRHSDYTPHSLLVRTKFYRKVLVPMHADYAASLVVWRASTWLATFTIMRNLRQGDFGPADLSFMRMLRVHVSSAIKRLASRQERNLKQQSLVAFAEQSAQGVVILGWHLNVLHYNKAARGFLSRWTGDQARKLREVRLPADLRQALGEMMPGIQAGKPNCPLAPRRIYLRALANGSEERLVAGVSFVPAKALTISKGSFLIVISEMPKERSARLSGFDQLTPREAACIRCVARGMSNSAIARKLGVSRHTIRNQLSSALRKLGMKSRYEAAAAVIQSGGNF